jgi:TP901-1 family phage major tail protein
MPTSAFAGFTGKVYISVDGMATWVPVGETRDATLTVNQEEIDATSFDSIGWMENIVGLLSWEMSMESLYVYGDEGQTDLENALLGGQVIGWRFLPKVAEGNKGYQGQGFATSYEVNVPVDDAVSLSLSIKGSGYLETYIAS